MKHQLDHIYAYLFRQITTTCMYLREKGYKDPQHQAYQESFLIRLVMFQNELGLLLSSYDCIVKALVEYKTTGYFERKLTEKSLTVWTYCRSFFERMDCPLGQSTPGLDKWVYELADRTQTVIEIIEKDYPNLYYQVADHAISGDLANRVAAQSTKFDQTTSLYLGNIELSHSLREFNKRMNQVYTLLKIEASVENILDLATSEIPVY